jgi:hypothetical protein
MSAGGLSVSSAMGEHGERPRRRPVRAGAGERIDAESARLRSRILSSGETGSLFPWTMSWERMLCVSRCVDRSATFVIRFGAANPLGRRYTQVDGISGVPCRNLRRRVGNRY